MTPKVSVPTNLSRVPAGEKIRRPAAAKKSLVEEKSTGSRAWAAYAGAYGSRYGTDPVRNAKVNAQFSQLVKRLPDDEAADVARWYVTNSRALYVNSKHCVDLLLRDCEGLRTEWATGMRMSDTEARHADEHQASQEAVRWVKEHREELRHPRKEGKI